MKGLPGSADLRKRLYAVTELDQVEEIFATYLAGDWRLAPADEGDTQLDDVAA